MKLKLMDHQAAAVETAKTEKRRGLFHDTGTGKSILGLEIIRLHNVKTLIVSPLSLIEGAWLDEVRTWYPEINASNLWTAKKRTSVSLYKALEADLCLINFESFKSIEPKLTKAGFEMVIIDESSKIKSPKSQISKSLIKFCDKVERVYLLSGTPAPNGIDEYFTQIRILNPNLWGKSFYKWRSKNFYPSGFGGYQWKVKPGIEEQLRADIATVSEYVSKDDVLDLPERTDSKRIFQLSPKEMKHYKEVKRDLVTVLDDGELITSPSAVAAIQKLRQISSGFVMHDDTVSDIGNSKMRELLDLLTEIGDKQSIIWINFKYEAQQVKDKLGKDAEILNSTATEKSKQKSLKAFKAGGLKHIICHPLSVGYGHTLTNCNEAIYYSSSYSYQEASQSRDRIYRFSQKNKCSYTYLLAASTIDETILRAVQRKEKSSQAILAHLKKTA